MLRGFQTSLVLGLIHILKYVVIRMLWLIQSINALCCYQWFEHANPEVVAACKAAIDLLQSAGLTKREIVLPELKELHLAHGVTITSEMRSFMAGT